MAYTALEAMRLANEEQYKSNVGPAQPELRQFTPSGNDLKSAVLRFLHDRCEGLGFSKSKEEEERGRGKYLGKSIGEDQIPYNMQRDIDRLCLERELESFIDSGVAEDAYTIYYCYLSIFFGHYGPSKKMVELLSEFESNGSSLLMKHRDHYSHSVYVFALGLAIYETNESYRAAFKKFYGLEQKDECTAAHFFLEFWGLTSLFHDIGYPFELPFEQVLSYFEVEQQKRGKGKVFIAYRDVDALTKISDKARKRFEEIYGRSFLSTNELLAFDVANKLGEAYGLTEEYLLDVFKNKPFRPDDYGYFMDHAWFSSARLYQELVNSFGGSALTSAHVDALSAILLHNSIFKFSISFYKAKNPEDRKAPLKMELHPLAYLLMYCDELQCWDRTAYGRNSRTELHPMAAEFDFSDGAINAVYFYDKDEQEKIDGFKRNYAAWEEEGEQGDVPRLKAYSDMAGKEQRFVNDITKIVDTERIPLKVSPFTREVNRHKKHTYLSSSNFLHLYDFAISLNGRYIQEEELKEVTPEQLATEFDALSLEYQLSNINQAKSFGRYLDAIRCFYTDRPVDYDMLTSFDRRQTQVFAPMEHERWVLEHQGMAWTAGNEYERLSSATGESAKDLRERFRMHKLTLDPGVPHEEILAHYQQLPEEDQGKDWKPFNKMLELIKLFDGLRIYRLDSTYLYTDMGSAGIRLDSYLGSEDKVVTIPDIIDGRPVTAVGEKCFENLTYIEELVLPETIETLHYRAFYGCKNLSKVNLPAGLRSTEGWVFAHTNLSEVAFPESFESLGYGTFYGCSHLESVALSRKTTRIGTDAFRNCEGLKSVIIPAGEVLIAPGAFDDKNNVTLVGVEGGNAKEYAADAGLAFSALA